MTESQLEELKQMPWLEFMKKYWDMRRTGQISNAQFLKLIEIKQDNPKQIEADVPFNEKAEKDVVEETLEMF